MHGSRHRRGLCELFGPGGLAGLGHEGAGRPLLRESWRWRPFSAGWLMGIVQGSPLIDDWVGQQRGYFAGYRLGWDYHDYWGAETRLAFSSIEVFDSQAAKDAQQAADDAAGIAPDSPWRNRYDSRRDCGLILWDVSLLYYPWGDDAWRPYALLGLGTATVDFDDRLAHNYHQTFFAMPLGLGVKYRYCDCLALRFEIADNIAFGTNSRVTTLHNLSITGALEIRFGGTRKAYWPWNPGRRYW